MVRNLQRPQIPGAPRRLQIKDKLEDLKLENFVTERISYFFDVLIERGTKSQYFLKRPLREWLDDLVFMDL